MIEHKQIFKTMECNHCEKEADRWKNKKSPLRKFISHVNDPNTFICCTCGNYVTIKNENKKVNNSD